MKQTKAPDTDQPAVAIAVILYGMSASSKPQAALFPASLSDRAIKAAGQLNLTVLKVTTADIADVAKRLPIGRINSSGKGFVPAVRQGLYDELLKAAEGSANTADTPTAMRTAKPNCPSIDFSKVPLNEARKAGNPVVGPDGLPRSWKDIAPNHLVLAQESASAGWAEVIVLQRNGDLLTVKWKSYPSYKPFVVHVDAVALLNASPSFKI